MDGYTTKPIQEVDKKLFTSEIRLPVIIHQHALDHLSNKQRKIFKEQELLEMVEKERPRKAYLQQNGRYAVFYRRVDGYRKIILDIEETKTIIVSFMDTPEIPKYKI